MQPIERMLAGIERAKAPNQRQRDASYRMGWINTPEEQSLIERAAEMRDISVNGFARRAVVAMACATLGIDYYEFMQDQKAGRVRTYHHITRVNVNGYESTKRRAIPGSENGKGAGAWRIRGLD